MLKFAANKSDHIDEIAQGQLKVINFLFAQNCSTPAEENLSTSTDPCNYNYMPINYWKAISFRFV